MKDLRDLPREPLARTPTPVHEATRLRAALGDGCPRILLKRDDLTDLAVGGNKARKLEFILGDARARGVTALVTTGGPQSNHARMTAAAAALCGMRCILILSGPGPRGDVGNLMLDRILGAEVRLLPADAGTAGEEDEIARAVLALEQTGEVAHVVALGGSNALGTLGYAEATRELLEQLGGDPAPTRLYHASGSRGTQAGLELGARLFGAPWRVHGVAVSGGETEKRRNAHRLIHEAAALLGTTVVAEEDDLLTHQDHYGEGYAIPTSAGSEAIALLARTEGVFLDPVYTAKAMAGLIAHIRAGEMGPEETVVFLHTGGVPGLFAMGARPA